jgi:hypothetical protein
MGRRTSREGERNQLIFKISNFEMVNPLLLVFNGFRGPFILYIGKPNIDNEIS